MAVFRVEKTRNYTVMSNLHFSDMRLSLKAKGLLSQMLSLPEDWDYTLRGLSKINKEKLDAIRTAVLELEGCGYIMRSQGRDENGRMTQIEYVIYEEPQAVSQEVSERTNAPVSASSSPLLENPNTEDLAQASPCSENPNAGEKLPCPQNEEVRDFPCSGNPYTGNPMSENPTELNTKEQKTKLTKDSIDRMRARVRENIEYDLLVYSVDRATLDEIVELIVETACSTKDTVRIVKDEFPAAYVRERLLKLDSEHIQYVVDCIEKTDKKIGNIKAYLLAALFNATVTIGGYYTTKVHYDMNRRE